MKHLSPRRFAPLVLLGTCLAGSALSPAQSAPVSEGMRVGNRVRAFYSWYVTQSDADKIPMSNRAKMNSYASKRLNRWLRSETFREYGADYFLQAQDFGSDWARARIQNIRVKGAAASLNATLGARKPNNEGMGERKLRLNLVKEGGVWKIDRVAPIGD